MFKLATPLFPPPPFPCSPRMRLPADTRSCVRYKDVPEVVELGQRLEVLGTLTFRMQFRTGGVATAVKNSFLTGKNRGRFERVLLYGNHPSGGHPERHDYASQWMSHGKPEKDVQKTRLSPMKQARTLSTIDTAEAGLVYQKSRSATITRSILETNSRAGLLRRVNDTASLISRRAVPKGAFVANSEPFGRSKGASLQEDGQKVQVPSHSVVIAREYLKSNK
jgi:hypothetical protein